MILNTKNVCLSYGKNEIVKDLNINIKKGEVVTIIGPNGCGKSTILKSLSRYLKPTKGRIYLDGEDIHKLDTKKIAKKMAILPQVRNIPEDFTVETLVSYGRFPHLNFGQRFKNKDYEIIEWALEKTRMEKFRNRNLNALSGGERQRAWIAMALAQKPEILLLDEPTTFLDISYQLEVLELVKELNETLGLTIIMVLHDLNQAARYSHKIFAIKAGRVFSCGKPHDLISQKFLREVFRIDADIFEDSSNKCPYFIPRKVTALKGED
ncbi:ABC transporter ATP-binding protein [Maledivibacter halophilus]|uniref:Iron complex transport system ATP-binding protein n=1 Tax=Maledivibacter halophilus TaxID=36842 RepID=A0A1T5MBG1_9FIRM|nr:ABC transporter ATP-binding protein [Maledivibacter halophilus]SKC85581.1 iron complex transport system ATP-binding protein [Maledivibacter halophilus]